MNKILCSLATRGRYFTTLPLVLNAVINQTQKVDKLIVFDDNDEPKDMRKEFLYAHLFQIMDLKGIPWEWVFADKKGQHHIHQRANTLGYDWVWRVDDDAVPEPNVLESLYLYAKKTPTLGAVGGSILTPPIAHTSTASGKIDDIDKEPNVQWGIINNIIETQHLHCSFLYRAGIQDYNLGLSRVAHREETLFTWGLHSKGYKILCVPDAITWHLKNPEGGIRTEDTKESYEHDEHIFRNFIAYKDYTIVVLNSGLGDHIVFSKVLKDIKNPLVFTCYPEIIEGRSIAEAQYLFGSIDQWDIYKKMDQWGWVNSLESAYRKLYT